MSIPSPNGPDDISSMSEPIDVNKEKDAPMDLFSEPEEKKLPAKHKLVNKKGKLLDIDDNSHDDEDDEMNDDEDDPMDISDEDDNRVNNNNNNNDNKIKIDWGRNRKQPECFIDIERIKKVYGKSWSAMDKALKSELKLDLTKKVLYNSSNNNNRFKVNSIKNTAFLVILNAFVKRTAMDPKFWMCTTLSRERRISLLKKFFGLYALILNSNIKSLREANKCWLSIAAVHINLVPLTNGFNCWVRKLNEEIIYDSIKRINQPVFRTVAKHWNLNKKLPEALALSLDAQSLIGQSAVDSLINNCYKNKRLGVIWMSNWDKATRSFIQSLRVHERRSSNVLSNGYVRNGSPGKGAHDSRKKGGNQRSDPFSNPYLSDTSKDGILAKGIGIKEKIKSTLLDAMGAKSLKELEGFKKRLQKLSSDLRGIKKKCNGLRVKNIMQEVRDWLTINYKEMRDSFENEDESDIDWSFLEDKSSERRRTHKRSSFKSRKNSRGAHGGTNNDLRSQSKSRSRSRTRSPSMNLNNDEVCFK